MRTATTLALPELEAAHPDLPLRLWSRDEDGYLGEDKYLGGSRFRLGRIVEDDTPNPTRVDFTVVVDSLPLRQALRAAGRTLVIVERWAWDEALREWFRGPRGFRGRLNSGTISGGVLSGEIVEAE